MIRRLLHLLLLGLSALVGAHTVSAQTVRWDPIQGTLAVGQTSELQLVFEDCSPTAQPRLPSIDGLTLEFAGQSTSTSIINFTRSDSVTFTYAARLSKNQRVTIPSFEVETNKGKFRTPVATFDPGAATVGGTGVALDNAAASRLVATPASVWAGEVFTLTYSLDASRNYFPDFGRGQIEWNAEPLVAEDWSRPEPLDFRLGNEPRTGLTYRTRAVARTPGSLRLNAVNQLLNLSVGVTGFGFFQQRQYQQYSVTSATPVLEVKPLPAAPSGFNGAVGDLKLTSKVVPLTAAVGEPITWTLELTGTANWPDLPGLPSRAVSKNFQVISPQAKRTPAEGKLFDATLAEDVVLVPSKAGSYTLAPVTFTYFDPKAGAYKTLTTAATTVTITEPAPSGLNLNVMPAAAGQASVEDQKPKTPPVPAAAPLALPREPVFGSAHSPVPLAQRTVVLLCVAPFALLGAFWLALALRHARVTDPLRPRREARARLQKLLTEISSAPPAALTPLLLRWQHDTALLLQTPSAAPTATDLTRSPAFQQLADRNAAIENLTALWRESDRALYAENIPLPADWTTRAQTALAATPLPGFSPLRLFLPRNLFPFVAALLLFTLLSPIASAAETQNPAASAAAAYRRGDFPAAEKTYRASLAKTPLDSLAHHNLSLALAQQDRWDESAAHAAVALVQNPAHESIRAQFTLAAEKSGHVPAPLAAFIAPGLFHQLVLLTSPARWQLGLIFGCVIAAGAIGGLLAGAYLRSSRRTLALAWSVLGLSVCTAITSLGCWLNYGPATDERAAIIWRAGTLRSIPTEADTAQKTTPLAAGSLAQIDKSFLGWRHLRFEAGQSGWVRNEDLVPIWR
jgi:tetratricopeptide (TPR) repeat protein